MSALGTETECYWTAQTWADASRISCANGRDGKAEDRPSVGSSTGVNGLYKQTGHSLAALGIESCRYRVLGSLSLDKQRQGTRLWQSDGSWLSVNADISSSCSLIASVSVSLGNNQLSLALSNRQQSIIAALADHNNLQSPDCCVNLRETSPFLLQ